MSLPTGAIPALTAAMTGLWKISGIGVPRNWGLFVGVAPQRTPPLFATFNIVPPGDVIMSMGPANSGTNIDDLRVQITCYADQHQGCAMCMALAAYADTLYHRQPLTMTGWNLVGMYRVHTFQEFWSDEEKLWRITKIYCVMVG